MAHTHTHTHTQAHTPFSITIGRGWYSNRGAHALWMLTPFCLLTPVRKTHRRCCRSICRSVPKHAPLIRKTTSMTPPNSSHVILQVYKEANHTPHTHSQHNHVNTPTLAHKKRRHPESNQARLVRRVGSLPLRASPRPMVQVRGQNADRNVAHTRVYY